MFLLLLSSILTPSTTALSLLLLARGVYKIVDGNETEIKCMESSIKEFGFRKLPFVECCKALVKITRGLIDM